MKHCAILSMDNLENFEAYDYLFEEPLLALGWQTQVVSWRQNDVDWDQFDVVVIRTPWDYQDDAPAFLALLEQIEASNAVLENSLDIVRWNIDKAYLKLLEDKGVTIVPTLWQTGLTGDDIEKFFAHFDTQQIVFKPRISANADNTFWLTKDNYSEKTAELVDIFGDAEFMVQPFMENIISEGEFSCFYFDGEYSHSILKTPKQDDFRVQEEHGGQLKTIEPERELTRCAKNALTAIGEMPLYARVDFVRHQDSFALMEAELIEPSLYFNMDDNAAERFAQAFVKRMQRVHGIYAD
ncbi:RimK family alpha-L-glutamate ligase [Colwelliaceae bacterium 6471]